ncbi:hypothetical protein Gorai_005775, partial [Gossypium raimondii]|nr:hypothetical protein [Gossypium raimondii]
EPSSEILFVNVLKVKSYNNGHILTTFVAEALACVQVVRFEAESSFLRVEVDGDVLAIIKKILSGEEDRYEIRDYILDVKRLRSNFLGPSRLTYKVEEEEVEGIMSLKRQIVEDEEGTSEMETGYG